MGNTPTSVSLGPTPGLQQRLQQGLRWCLLLALAVGAIAALRTLWPATLADLNTATTRAGMMRWREHPRPVALKEWAAWRADLLLHDHLGYLYGAYAQQSKGAPDLARDFYLQAYTSFNRAASLRPMAPELAQNAGLAARLSQQPSLQAKALFWDCRAIRYTAPGVALADHLAQMPPDRCR